jgi:ppGpp synthetase/RelA/SpoT-type nucleotidyltranferase
MNTQENVQRMAMNLPIIVQRGREYPVIETFVQQWDTEYPRYARFSQGVEAVCAAELKRRGIRHRTTSRAKPKSSLSKSVYRRQQARQSEFQRLNNSKLPYVFETEEEIKKDMIDLAGVRIFISDPDDTMIVRHMIEEVFAPWLEPWGVKTASYLDDSINRFSGIKKPVRDRIKKGDPLTSDLAWPLDYKALHLRCKLKPPHACEYSDGLTAEEIVEFQNMAVEIQVGTSIMYAWSDEYHDIVYKPYFGEISAEETAFLNILSGLAHTGELALRQLHTSLRLRKSLEDGVFRAPWQFSHALRTAIDARNLNIFEEEVALLVDLFPALDVNTPDAVRKAVEGAEKLLDEERSDFDDPPNDFAIKYLLRFVLFPGPGFASADEIQQQAMLIVTAYNFVYLTVTHGRILTNLPYGYSDLSKSLPNPRDALYLKGKATLQRWLGYAPCHHQFGPTYQLALSLACRGLVPTNQVYIRGESHRLHLKGGRAIDWPLERLKKMELRIDDLHMSGMLDGSFLRDFKGSTWSKILWEHASTVDVRTLFDHDFFAGLEWWDPASEQCKAENREFVEREQLIFQNLGQEVAADAGSSVVL